MQMLDFQPLKPKVILGVAAHPDDLDFGASGTLTKYATQGAEIHYLLLTDGSKGTADYTMTTVELIKMRQQEQRDALKAIGGTDVQFLEYPDGELEVTMDLKRDIIRSIRSLKPDVVVTMDPSVIYSAERGMINHPDHRAAGQATLDAVFPLARDHLSFPELFAAGLEPHKVATLLLINFNECNFTVDISETMGKKIEALKAHESQMPDMEKVNTLVKDIASNVGSKCGCKYAEGFVRIDLPA